MMIKYNKVNILTLATHDAKNLSHIKPGWNEIPVHIWDANKNDKEIVQFLEDKVLELLPEAITPKGKKASKLSDEPFSLKSLDEKKAIEIVKGTHSRDILVRWDDEETRHKVKRALDEQLKNFKSES